MLLKISVIILILTLPFAPNLLTKNVLWVYLFNPALKFFSTALDCVRDQMIGTAITTMIMESSLSNPYCYNRSKKWAGKYSNKFSIFAVLKFPYLDVIAVDSNWTDHILEIMKSPEEYASDRLKVVSLSQRQIHGWKSKTCLLDNDAIHKVKEILLFTDSGSNYFDNNTISMAVSYMQNHNLDVFTVLAF